MLSTTSLLCVWWSVLTTTKTTKKRSDHIWILFSLFYFRRTIASQRSLNDLECRCAYWVTYVLMNIVTKLRENLWVGWSTVTSWCNLLESPWSVRIHYLSFLLKCYLLYQTTKETLLKHNFCMGEISNLHNRAFFVLLRNLLNLTKLEKFM